MIVIEWGKCTHDVIDDSDVTTIVIDFSILQFRLWVQSECGIEQDIEWAHMKKPSALLRIRKFNTETDIEIEGCPVVTILRL